MKPRPQLLWRRGQDRRDQECLPRHQRNQDQAMNIVVTRSWAES